MVNRIQFSKNDEYILTCSDDETAKLLDTKGNIINVYKGHKGGVQTSAFSKDGNYILTSGLDGTIKKWPILIDDVLKLIEGKDNDGKLYRLSEAEKKQYGLIE